MTGVLLCVQQQHHLAICGRISIVQRPRIYGGTEVKAAMHDRAGIFVIPHPRFAQRHSPVAEWKRQPKRSSDLEWVVEELSETGADREGCSVSTTCVVGLDKWLQVNG